MLGIFGTLWSLSPCLLHGAFYMDTVMHMTSDKCWPGLGGKNSLLSAIIYTSVVWHHHGITVGRMFTSMSQVLVRWGLSKFHSLLGPGICISFPDWAVVWSRVLLPPQLETASLTFELRALLVWGSLKTDLKSFQAHDSSLALSLSPSLSLSISLSLSRSLSLCATFTHNKCLCIYIYICAFTSIVYIILIFIYHRWPIARRHSWTLSLRLRNQCINRNSPYRSKQTSTSMQTWLRISFQRDVR